MSQSWTVQLPALLSGPTPQEERHSLIRTNATGRGILLRCQQGLAPAVALSPFCSPCLVCFIQLVSNFWLPHFFNTKLSSERYWQGLGSQVVRGEGNYTYWDPRWWGERGIIPAGTPGGEGREELYLTLHCHHQNDFCIKVGSDENHFKDLLIVKGKVTSQSP